MSRLTDRQLTDLVIGTILNLCRSSADCEPIRGLIFELRELEELSAEDQQRLELALDERLKVSRTNSGHGVDVGADMLALLRARRDLRRLPFDQPAPAEPDPVAEQHADRYPR